MALLALPCPKVLRALKSLTNYTITARRNLISKQLVYNSFGDPVQVVKFRECVVPPLGSQEVLVRMLAAPVNPADINIIQGRNIILPPLPTVPGDEGVGDVVEVGNKVCRFTPGNRVIITDRMLGTWRYYGIYNERSLQKISKLVPLPEAAMITNAPCIAYRLLTDYTCLNPGDTVVQNAANSAIGQCVIQMCNSIGCKTLNIVANHCGYEAVKEYLLSLGATAVYTLEEAESLTTFDTSVTRPILALNCLYDRYEDVLLRLLDRNRDIVYYGRAFNLPLTKQLYRCDARFHKFHYGDWSGRASEVEKCQMYNKIVELMVVGKLRAPLFTPLELKDFIFALKNTEYCEACTIKSYLFDFTLT